MQSWLTCSPLNAATACYCQVKVQIITTRDSRRLSVIPLLMMWVHDSTACEALHPIMLESAKDAPCSHTLSMMLLVPVAAQRQTALHHYIVEIPSRQFSSAKCKQATSNCCYLFKQSWQTCLGMVQRRRGSLADPISEDDILRAIGKLKALGSGFAVERIGKQALVRSVPGELNTDKNKLLELGQATG